MCCHADGPGKGTTHYAVHEQYIAYTSPQCCCLVLRRVSVSCVEFLVSDDDVTEWSATSDDLSTCGARKRRRVQKEAAAKATSVDSRRDVTRSVSTATTVAPYRKWERYKEHVQRFRILSV